MKKIILILGILAANCLYAQDIEYAKSMVDKLCSNEMQGRGYVNNGVNKAAIFLEQEFKNLKLKPINKSFTQIYGFDVNTHPTLIKCQIDEKAYRVGYEFIVNAACPSITGKFNLIHFNWKDSADKLLLMDKIQKGFKANEALVLRYGNERSTHILDSFEKYQTQPGFVVFTEEKKITHTIAREVNKIASITIFDSLIQNKESLLIELKNEFVDVFKCKNIMGMVKGKSKDSFIVYTAHYDHLGMQAEAMFPGASDNASGVSMILSLAKYYAKNKPNYDTYFLLFSGEEAGLLGSHYFVDYPTFSLSRIKFLMNIDIMGNAENGIMIVNGEANKQKYDLMSSINNQKKYVPEVKIRGKAANSDHYFFSEKGVPAIFIYSLGGQGYYHDVQDRAENLLYTNYENVFRLIRDFTDQL